MAATIKVRINRDGMNQYTDMYEVLTFHADSEQDMHQWLTSQYPSYDILDVIPD